MMIDCTGVAVRSSEGWVALCPEYDLAADGRTWSEALSRLAGAIEKAVETAQREKLAIGRPLTEEQLNGFLAAHVSTEMKPVRRHYQIDTDKIEVLTVATETIR